VFPVVLSLPICKELAPIENCNVYRITVGIDPELAANDELSSAPGGAIQSHVPETVAAKERNTTESFWSFHEA
jgi:hypothetical protein